MENYLYFLIYFSVMRIFPSSQSIIFIFSCFLTLFPTNIIFMLNSFLSIISRIALKHSCIG